MSENRNEADTTNRPHPALVNLLLFIESVVAELKSEVTDAAWDRTLVEYHARQGISHLIQMAWAVQGLTGVTTPYFSASTDGVNRLEARPQWAKLVPEGTMIAFPRHFFAPDDAESVTDLFIRTPEWYESPESVLTPSADQRAYYHMDEGKD